MDDNSFPVIIQRQHGLYNSITNTATQVRHGEPK